MILTTEEAITTSYLSHNKSDIDHWRSDHSHFRDLDHWRSDFNHFKSYISCTKRDFCHWRSDHSHIINNYNNGEFLYSAHALRSSLQTHYRWSLDLFIRVQFQLPFGAYSTNRTHCHLCSTRYSFTPESREACEGKVPYPRTQHRNNVPIWMRDSKPHAGSDIGKAPRSNHCATSLSFKSI